MSAATFCTTCGAAHQGQDRFCVVCGAPLPAAAAGGAPLPAVAAESAGPRSPDGATDRPVVTETSAPAPASGLWGARTFQVATGLLLLATVGLGAAWIGANRELRSLRSDKAALQTDVARLSAERAALARPLVAANRIFNAQLVDGRLNVLHYGTAFDRDAVYYIGYVVDGPNQSFGIREVKGELNVKYIRPDRSILPGSPPGPTGFSFAKSISIPTTQRTWQTVHSLGSNTAHVFEPGNWLIEWWWQDTKIGEAAFKINPSVTFNPGPSVNPWPNWDPFRSPRR